MHHDDAHEHDHDHDRGLSLDLPTLLGRRRALALLGGVGLATLAGCSTGSDASVGAASTSAAATTSSAAASTSAAVASTAEIPEETAGPFPGDGSNGVNVLTESGIVRSDLTHSFGAATGVAAGVPLTIKLKVIDVSNSGKALAGAAVYLWHCNIDGEYSLYSQAISAENYLRGVQEADADGAVTFTSIYPAAYSGRWPHIHFEVYSSLATATAATDKLRTSQLALPEAANSLVYATAGYEQSVTNMAQSSLATDNIFSDGYSLQLATVTGDVTSGMTATLNVPV